MTREDLWAAADALRAARRVTVFTGAGISAESQIPTFRDRGGIWDRFDETRFATWKGLLRTTVERPSEVAAFAEEVLRAVGSAKPNPGHQAIAGLERHRSTRVITQNIDGLHQAAGSTTVREIHGSLLEVVNLGGRRVRELERATLLRLADRAVGVGPGFFALPRLLRALGPLVGLSRHGFLHPNVVLFGAALKAPDWSEAQMDAERCDLMLVVGTSGTVMPAAGLPLLALKRGAMVIAVDPDADLSAHIRLADRAGQVLPQLVDLAFG